MIYIGIDPGKTGGIAWISQTYDEPPKVFHTCRMPETERDLFDALNIGHPGTVAMLERVGASPQMGTVSAFTFGRGYGALLMGLTASLIPFDLVAPAKWQLAMGCRTKGDKNISKRRAQQLFPHLTITHAIADALLIAEYCRRVSRGNDATESKEPRTETVKGTREGGAQANREGGAQGVTEGRRR